MGHTGDFFRARDEYRRHPFISNNFRRAFPGLGIATVAFSIYLIGENIYERMSKPDSAESHNR
ncbi:hypothetical protein KP509_19G075500 [Ceratopteris richardii]|uniref:Uncharacterized protein n=1 Tax=Ceratopteris richardii TaxID=49495 RepID=A0A8T2SNP6_CERRI|nr:hypothetical protein KP509_19G075500 [Ceratopteris richardii]